MAGAPVKRLPLMSVREAVGLWGDSWRIGLDGLLPLHFSPSDDDVDGFVMDDAARVSAEEGRCETMGVRATYGLSPQEQEEAGL